MRKLIKMYTPFINAGIQETIAYRVDVFFYLLGEVFTALVSYFIWKAVFMSSGEQSLNGFTMPQMIVYIFLMFFTTLLISSDGTYNIGEEIRDGSIAMRLIKPISYNATFLFQEIGNKLLTITILIVPVLVGIEALRTHLTGELQFDIVRFLLYLFSCALGYLINFYFNICFGFIAFAIKYLWGANMMKNCIVGFLSGAIIPLSFLPDTIEKVLLLFPFASLNYTPVMIYLGKYDAFQTVSYIGLQMFWVLLFAGLSKLLWGCASKRLTIQGG